MKIKSSSTIIWYGKSGGGIGSKSASSKSPAGRNRSGRASYGASGFGTGGTAEAGKSRYTPPPRPPRRRP